MSAEPGTTLTAPEKVANKLESSGFFDAKTVGPNTISAISIMGEHEKLAGNVLRRLCKLGGEVCATTCSLSQGTVETANANVYAKCADNNLTDVIGKLGTRAENIFMVGVTADGVGFVDEIDSQPDKYPYKTVETTGVKELPGFNAFFAREGDQVDGDELKALGRRLADCGDINMEFTDKDGKNVMGFMHMTKPNLHGEGAQNYDYQGKKVGSFEYFLRSAIDHYGADISSVTIRVAAAIRPEHWNRKFADADDMDKQGFVGWANTNDADGRPLLKNQSNPNWQPGEPFSPDDEWFADFTGMLHWQMSQVHELQPEQVNWRGFISAGDPDSPHASHSRGQTNPAIKGRDAYFTAWADKLSM